MNKILKKLFFSCILVCFLIVFCGFLSSPFNCNGVRTGGVFKSLDKGETWNQKVRISEERTISSVNILDIVIDPLNEDIIYLGTVGNGIYKSTDAGETWIKIGDINNLLESRADVYQIIIDPNNTNLIFACIYQNSKGYLIRSNDGGGSWEELYTVSEKKKKVLSVAMDSFSSKNIFIGTDQGLILQSSDYGISWDNLHWFSNIGINKVIINPNNSDIIYISTNTEGIWKSVDRGNHWIPLDESWTEFSGAQNVESFILDKNNPNTLYTGSRYGLLKSSNAGETWESLNVPFPNKTLLISSIAIDSNDSSVVYFGDGSYLYKSLDSGKTWQLIKIPTAKRIKDIEINKKNTNIIYLGINN